MKQLRFTTTRPHGILSENKPEPLVTPKDKGVIIPANLRHDIIYIHGGAEVLAKFDIPEFIDGDFGQLDLPVEKQDILMVLPDGSYKCKAIVYEDKRLPERYRYRYFLILEEEVETIAL